MGGKKKKGGKKKSSGGDDVSETCVLCCLYVAQRASLCGFLATRCAQPEACKQSSIPAEQVLT